MRKVRNAGDIYVSEPLPVRTRSDAHCPNVEAFGRVGQAVKKEQHTGALSDSAADPSSDPRIR